MILDVIMVMIRFFALHCYFTDLDALPSLFPKMGSDYLGTWVMGLTLLDAVFAVVRR